ncbi:MAG: class I SAM-dependent methyltransferase [Thermoanaerobaculia bacterium]
MLTDPPGKTPAFDLIAGGVPRFRAEAPWAWRLLSRYVRGLPADRRVEASGREVRVSDAAGDAPIVLVLADPEAYLLPEVGIRLVAALVASPELDLVLPVSNEAETEEARLAPPFAYPTPTLLAEAVEFLAREAGPLRPTAAAPSPVYAIRREALRKLPPDLPLRRVPDEAGSRGLAAAIDPGAYVHRYGAMDASAREDLAERIPAGARAVLDVGCSRGATAAALRGHGVGRIVGIEPDAEDAAAAALLYDEVLTSRLEEAAGDFQGRFDAILFGDVLEHLEDPSDALVRARPWLAPDGVVVASVPNVGHWSVIDDLLRGRFDYVPYSLLSGTHVRFFTRRTLEDLFEASGYRVTSIETVVLPPSPLGQARLARLRAFPSASGDLDVAEFLAVARSDGA